MKLIVSIDTDTKQVVMETDSYDFRGWSIDYSLVNKGVENVTIGELIQDALEEFTENEEK